VFAGFLGCCLPFAVAAVCLQGAAILVCCGFPFAVRCVLLRVGVSSVLVTLSEGLLFWLGSSLSTVEARVYLQTCGLVLRVSLAGKGLGPLVF